MEENQAPSALPNLWVWGSPHAVPSFLIPKLPQASGSQPISALAPSVIDPGLLGKTQNPEILV